MVESNPYQTPAFTAERVDKSRPLSDALAGPISLLLTVLSVVMAAGSVSLFQSVVVGFLASATIYLFAAMFAVRAFTIGGYTNWVFGIMAVIGQIGTLLLAFAL